MRVVFAGTSDFAVPSLEALIASRHEVVAVISQPDKPSGRGLGLRVPPVKEVAQAHSIPVLQPERIRSPEAIAQIRGLGDVGALVVAAYGQIIPKDLLKWPTYGAINIHASILPKYRGAAPIQHALIAGETRTGVTTMLMDEGLDTGDILLQESIDILADENARELTQRLARLGADLLLRTLDGLEDGTIAPVPQNDELASIARSLPNDVGAIDWSLPASDIVNRVRGCTPRPGAFTRLGAMLLKVWLARVEDQAEMFSEPGQILLVDQDGIVVAAGSGSVRLVEVQPESRKRMTASEFARGHKISPGDRFEVRC